MIINIGNRIRFARKSKGVTQGELAERVGYSTNMIYRYENHKSEPSFIAVQLIANALNMDLKDLLFKEFPMSTGDRLRNLRIERGLTAKKMAAYIGVAESTIRAWECGEKEVTRKRVDSLAYFFRVSPEYILEGNKTE